jgi:hypothetical protein
MGPQDTHISPIILCSSWKTLELLLSGKGSVLCTVSVISPLLLYKYKLPYQYPSELNSLCFPFCALIRILFIYVIPTNAFSITFIILYFHLHVLVIHILTIFRAYILVSGVHLKMSSSPYNFGIHSFISNLSHDRSTAFSKTIPLLNVI